MTTSPLTPCPPTVIRYDAARPVTGRDPILAGLLARIVALCDDPLLTWRLASDPGSGDVHLLAVGAPGTIGAVGAVLDELYVSCQEPGGPTPVGYRFGLHPVGSSPFFALEHDGCPRRWTSTGAPPFDPAATALRLADLAVRYPGLILELDIAGAPSPRSTRLVVRVGWVERALPPQISAELALLFPGLTIGTVGSDNDWPFEVDAEQLDLLWALPAAVAGVPVPGMRTAPAPPIPVRPLPVGQGADLRGVTTRIGTVSTGPRRIADATLTAAERGRPIHVLGQTGTGKSTFLRAQMHALAKAGEGFTFLDPHGTTVAAVLDELPESARRRTWSICLADLDNPVPMNPLAVADPGLRDLVIQDITEVMYHLFDPEHTGIVGPRFEVMMRMALRGLANLHGPRASLLDAPRVYADHDLQQQVAQAARTTIERDHWKVEAMSRRSSEYGDRVSWFTSKFDRFNGTPALRAVLGSGIDAFDPATAMDGNRIVLIDLSKGRLGEQAARLLGFLFISRYWAAALQRVGRNQHTLVIDEAHSFVSGGLTSILAEGRKFGLSAVVAHQYLGQLLPSLAAGLTGNAATLVAFRSGVTDAQGLRAAFGGRVGVDTLTDLPDLTAICRRTVGPVAAAPHTLMVDHNERVTARAGAARRRWIDQITRATHAELVDPHRAAIDPYGEAEAAEPEQVSFLDQWLVQHRASTG